MRVLSAADNNHITFDPDSVSPPVTLGAGQWTEIGPVSKDFRVTADNKILVAQFMVGANTKSPPAPGGDPSESIAIPSEQFRSAYTFYAPTSYTSNYVNVVAPTGSTVTLDGSAISPNDLRPSARAGSASLVMRCPAARTR